MKHLENRTQWQASNDVLEKVFTEIILGRPSAKCKHFGICEIKKIYARSFFKHTSGYYKCPKTVYAFASLKPDVYFELAFLRHYMAPDIFKLHFKRGIFSVDEDYITNSSFMKCIVHIQKGQYPVHFSETLLTVRFGLG